MEIKSTTIKAGMTLSTRSICDHNCIYSIDVISRTVKTATIKDTCNRIKRTKIHIRDGVEFLMPERYSFAPIFKVR
jgi:hypothetical protein